MPHSAVAAVCDRRSALIERHQQWHICFEWRQGAEGPENVEIVDYH